MKVTVSMLKKLGACEPQVELFKSLYPKGIAITAENAQNLQDNTNLNVDWLFSKFDISTSESPSIDISTYAEEGYDFNTFVLNCGCVSCAKFRANHPDVVEKVKNAKPYEREVGELLAALQARFPTKPRKVAEPA